jgi:hypothetical protein
MSFDPSVVLSGSAFIIAGGSFVLVAKYMGRCERKFQQLDDVTEDVYRKQQTTIREEKPPQLQQPKRQAPPQSRIISGGQVAQPRLAAPQGRQTQRRAAPRPKQEVDPIYHPRSAELFQGEYQEGVVYYHER